MRNRLFPNLDKHTVVMGIINLTEDSFSGDGLESRPRPVEAALAQAAQFLADGAEILDLGAESTRPGALEVSAEEEIARLVPAVTAMRLSFPEAIISIDTYKAAVAQACLDAGAQIINDVWGLQKDPDMAATVAAAQASVVLMHNRSTKQQTELSQLGGRYIGVEYTDLISAVKGGLHESLALAQAAGISDDQIILDPGIGFGKTTEQNLFLVKNLDRLLEIGYPILLGISRKSFIGYTLDLPPQDRLEGSLAANAWGLMKGAGILRVHDVKATVRLARMLDAIRNAN